jgi:transcriptional regulator with XRE-family HTH domain
MESQLSPLRLTRLVRGKTQFEIARRAHLSASRLSLLERGHDEATTAERVALATALGTPEAELFPVATTGVSE